MFDFTVIEKTLPEAYHSALHHLYLFSEDVTDTDHDTRCKEISITMRVRQPLAEPMISRLIPCGAKELEQYRQEMLDGILDCCIGHGWDYTYHDRIYNWHGINQIDYIISELKRNPTSRRAVIDVRSNADDINSNDAACLQHIQYFVRNGKLDCYVLFRSNDACKAAFMNAFALIMLQKRIADALGVGMGTYTHRANSFHAYERDWELLEAYYDRIGTQKNLYYDYHGEWEVETGEAVPEIMRKAEEMRKKYAN